MFGVTTPCVTTARARLEELGYEVLVFHATGAGGQSMEALARGGFLVGVLDATTTELADELVGGVLSAGPDRLEAAGAAGLPQVGLARGARHGQLRPARDGAAGVRGAESLRPQPDRDLDADDRGGMRRARPDDRPQARGRDGADRGVRPARRRLDDRRGRAAVPRSRGGCGARRGVEGDARGCASCTSSRRTSTTRHLRPRWPIGCTSSSRVRREPRRRARCASRAGRSGCADHRRRRRHRVVGEARRGGRRRSDHHLQQWPLPHGGPRLAGGADAVRRCKRDRRRHGARGAAGRAVDSGARGSLRHRSVSVDAASSSTSCGASASAACRTSRPSG